MKKNFYSLTFLLAILFSSFSNNVFADKDYSVKFVWGQIEISENLNEFIKEKIAPEEITQNVYYRYVQFYDIPSNSVRMQLEAKGIKFLSYIPNNLYVVSIPVDFNKSELSFYNIRSVVPIEANFKMHIDLQNQFYPEWALIGSNEIKLVVSHYKNLLHSNVVEKLQSMNVKIVEEYSELRNITIQVPLNKIELIASLAYVEYVEPILPPGEPEDYEGGSLHRSNAVKSKIAGSYMYDGTGVKTAVNDDGFVGPHIDFTGRIDNSEVAGDFTGSHGDGVAGIVGAAGNLNPRNVGMAPGAFIKVRQYNQNLPGVIALHQVDSIMMFNSSYSNGVNAGYTNTTVQVDDEISNNPSLIQIFSAGNSNGAGSTAAGSNWYNITGGHKAAKNCITTANLSFDDALTNSSSRGPASDGRIKPDISANGTNHVSTDPNNQYSPFGGTSAAAPGIMGCTAQLYHAYKDLNGGSNPESGLIKASILNTAYDLGNSGPDFKFGWGRINTVRALRLLEDVRYMSDSISQGGTNTHDIIVPAGAAQLRAMIYWIDVAGNTVSSKALVNDLNSRIFTPASDTLLPLVLNPTPNATILDLPAVPGVDDLNNVEQIRLDNPPMGVYTFEVKGLTVPFGPQKYFVLYEFETESIEVTYPQGGEGFSPFQSEVIRWDAFADSSTFDLEYSIDNGLTWNTIVTGLSGNTRHYGWTTPNSVTSEALVRVTRDGVSDQSDANFTIIGKPTGVNFSYACPDSFQIIWNTVNGSINYEVSMLGNKYMDVIGTTTNTSFTVTGVNPIDDYWVSVRAIETNGGYGDRANAVLKSPGIFNCAINVDGNLEALVSPTEFVSSECPFPGVIDLRVRIRNTGITTISNFPIYYSVNNGTPVMETVTGSISPNATQLHTFTNQPTLSGTGTFTIKTWVEVINDGNKYNDTISFVYDVFANITTPFFDDFETFDLCNTSSNCSATDCELDNGWINLTNGLDDDIDFRTDRSGTPSNTTGPDIDHAPGTNLGKYVYTEASNQCFNEEAWMVSPCIDLTNTPNAKFKFWYHMWGDDMGELHVDIFSNGLWVLDVITPISGDQGNQWLEETVDLNAYNNQFINVRFRGITGNDFSSDIAIDDINLSTLTGIENTNSTVNILLYPNPGNEVVNLVLNNLQGNNATIRIADELGRLVTTKKISNVANNATIKLDIKNYTSGVYLLEVENKYGSSHSKLIVN